MKRYLPLIILFLATLSWLGTTAQNNCLDFAGVNNYVNIPSISTDGFAGLTIEAWVYPHTFNPQTGDDYISNIAGHLDASSLLRIGDNDPAELQANDIAQFTVQTASGIKKCSGTTALQANRWYHLAGTYDGSNLRLYVNGILEKTVAHTGNVSATETSMEIAGSTAFIQARYLDGLVDELRIWNDARTEAEIRQNMYRELPNPSGETNLVAYYKLNQISGTTATDSKGSYNGTLTNMSGSEWQTSPAMFGPKNALAFSGGEVSVSSTFGLGAVSVSGECWVYLPTANENGTFFNVGGHDDGYGIGVGNGTVETSGNNLIVIYDNVRWIDSQTPIGTGWHHVAFTIDALGRCTMYLDGISVYAETGDPADPIGPTGQTGIGTDVYLNRTLSNGTLDEVRIWSDVRTETEFRENMCKNLSGNESGLVAYYNLDNIVYSPTSELYMIADHSGNGYNAFTGSMFNLNLVTSSAFNTWLNTSSTAWNSTTNWSLGSVPNSSSVNVGISDHLTAYDPVISSAIQMNNLVVGGGATLDFNYNGSHTIHGNVFNIGTTNLDANTELTISGSLFVLPLSTLNIRPEADLTIDKNLETSFLLGDGNLQVKSDATGTGSLIVKGSSSGEVVVKKFIDGWTDATHGWHFLSSPVTSQAISPEFVDVTANPIPSTLDFYRWSEPLDLWVNIKNGESLYNQGSGEENFSNDASPTFTPGKGYLIAYESTSTKAFTGDLNNANVPVSGLTNTPGNTYAGWHLLGNPFPCALDFNAGTWSKSGTIGTYAQIWNESAASYKVLAGEQIIPAMNGFMVYTSADGGSLTIPTDARVHSDTNWYKSSLNASMIVLNAIDPAGNTSQQTLIDFNPDATNGFDLKYDALYMAGFAPMFYSTGSGKLFALNCLPQFRGDLEIPLGFVKNQGSDFFIQLEQSLPEITVYLTDLKTNTTQNLTNNPIYAFTAEEGDNPNRFLLHFKAVGIDDPELNTTSLPIHCWNHNQTITISNPEQLSGTVMVYNITGQPVLTTALQNVTKQTITHQLVEGMYVVQVRVEGRVKNQKIMVP